MITGYHPGPFQKMDIDGVMGFTMAAFAWCATFSLLVPGAARVLVPLLGLVIVAATVSIVFPRSKAPEEPADIEEVLELLADRHRRQGKSPLPERPSDEGSEIDVFLAGRPARARPAPSP